MRFRVPIVSSVLIVSIAACSKSDPVANGADTVTSLPASAKDTAPSPAGGPPATAEPAAAAAASTERIPASLQGRWGLTPADCTSPFGDAKGLLVVNADELRFYESRAVPSVNAQADSNSVTGDFHFAGEGETWTRFESLKRDGDKLTRTETNPAASYTYAKC